MGSVFWPVVNISVAELVHSLRPRMRDPAGAANAPPHSPDPPPES